MTVTVVRVGGSPSKRGRAVGRALAEQIHRSLDFYRGFLEPRSVRRADLPTLLTPYRRATEDAFPDLAEELDGMAAGADAPPWEVFAANAWEELEPLLAMAPADRCTAFAVSGPDGTILAHNEQWYAGDDGGCAVVVAEPDDGPAFASPTGPAFLPVVGVNRNGLAQAVMSLSARDDGEGVPRVPVSSAGLRAADAADHLRRVTPPGRSGGYAYVVATPGAVGTVETSASRHARLESKAHTNHYLDPTLAQDGSANDGSVARLERLRTLLAEREPATVEACMDVLRDHHSEPQSICMHPEPAAGDEAVGITFSMVCRLEERRMWVAAGNPCTEPFEEIDVAEALR
ncbi:MAG TPA: C45 family peptidase [Actinomycetota bacterium]|nr:C45 family peptidase [Actinomycetota bacterium]